MNKLFKLLILVVIVKQFVWIAFIPLWHFPDEQAHFGQVANSAEIEKRQSGPNLTKEVLISERILQTERDWAGNNRFTYHPEYNIPYSNSNVGFFEKDIINFPINQRNIMVKEEATFYPPLYYTPAVLIYKAFYNENLLVRVFIVRLINIIYTIILIIIAYKIFNLIFDDQTVAFFTSALLLFHPMLSFVQGGINSDNLFNVIFSLGILVLLEILKKGLNSKRLILAFIIFYLAFKTKLHAYFLIPVYLVSFIYGLIRRKTRVQIFIVFSLIFISFFPILDRWSRGFATIPDIGFNMIKPRDMNFIQFFKWSIIHSYREVLPWYWGVFRWLSLTLPRIVNKVVNRVLLLALIGLFIYLVRIIKNKKKSFSIIGLTFFLYISIVYFLIIAGWDYLFYLTHGFSFGIQGRYFFPTIIPHIGVLVFGFLGFSTREQIRAVILKIAVLSMIVLHEISLFHVLFSYYSKSSISTFFIQASQYKPWFFKSPTLQFLLVAHLVILVYFVYRFIIVNPYEKTRV